MTKKSVISASTRQHPLEGDGCLINVFHQLWKKNAQTLESCPGVRLPPTVVYEHNFPREWIYFEGKGNELKKRTGKELDPKRIKQHFSKPVKIKVGKKETTELDICAYYISSCVKKGEESVRMEFFDADGLEKFLGESSHKEQGILQRFISPKGDKNSLVQAIWSPHVTLVERRTNKNKILDVKLPLYERAVTYEGPTHFSNRVFVAPQLVSQIKEVCQQVVDHFEATEHKRISRMVMYFKVDHMNNIWLLWASSIRVSDVGKPRGLLHNPKSAPSSIPLNLSPSFVIPRQHGTKAIAKPSKKKKAQSSYSQANTNGGTPTKKPPLESVKFKCPNCQKHKAGKRYTVPLGIILNNYKDEMKVKHPGSPKKSPKKQVDATPKKQNKDIQVVNNKLDDLLYEAYSHFLHKNDPFKFSLPTEIPSHHSEELKLNLLSIGVRETDDHSKLFIEHHTVSIGKLHKTFENFKRHFSSNTKEQPEDIHVPVEQKEEIANQAEDSQSNDLVPDVVLKFLPDLTNSSYRELRKEHLFMSIKILICESCFLTITDNSAQGLIKRSGARTSLPHKRRMSRSSTIGKKKTSRPSTRSSRSSIGRPATRGTSRKKKTNNDEYDLNDNDLLDNFDDMMEFK